MKTKFIAAVSVALGLALLTALPAGAGTYDITNLSMGGQGGNLVAGINANGQVAGTGVTVNNQYHAFVATRAGGIVDLGDLGQAFSLARKINASGQVVGDIGNSAGNIGDIFSSHAFSWTEADGMIDLGTLGGSWSTPVALNDAGKVAGVSENANGDYRGFAWTKAGGMVDLGALGGRFAWPYAMNASGQVVGFASNANEEFRAVIWQPGGEIVDLGALDATWSGAIAINDAGQVAGVLDYIDRGSLMNEHVFFWTPTGEMVDAGTLGGSYAWPTVVNPSGQVMGVSHIVPMSSIPYRGFAWTLADGLTDLTLGGNNSATTAMNAAGQVVGWAQTSGGSSHAYSWTKSGGMVDLGTFGGTSSGATSVNALGQVVGGANIVGDAASHAFIYDGSLKDLNDLVRNKPADMELFQAYYLTDAGLMVAWTNVGMVLLSPASTTSAPPVVGAISANDPVAVGATLSVSASFTDDTADTHTAAWTFGDGTPSAPGTVSETGGSGSVSGSHVYAAAGVYPVSVAVTDNGGLMSQVSRNVVVYDPSAGFVTGSGWINSPAGAFEQDLTAAGRATFGFVSRYQKGAKVPTGTTEFHFQSVGLNFHSDQYDWLVVGGARAQFKGMGTLNGADGYKFLLTAVDGQIPGGGGTDRFRIKIWSYDENLKQDVVTYDNQMDPSTEGTVSEGTAIGGGSIVIHTPNK
jgi:probable HAF family extracellular repeat protein